MAENLLSVGFNEQELDAQAKRVLKIVEDLHANLKKYENVKISPIDISGLQQLTASIKEQQGALSALQSSVAKLGLAMDEMGKKTKTANTALAGTAKGAKDATTALNANTSATNKNTAANVNHGKKILENNSLYKGLKDKVKELEIAYSNSILNKSPKGVQEGLAGQLREANKAVGTVEKSLEKAGSGGAALIGKNLSESLSVVRNLAYILPGLGMAGIFNLAFEAIAKAAEALGLFSNETEKAIERQGRLNTVMTNFNNILSNTSEELTEASKFGVDAAKRNEELAKASGENYTQLADDRKKTLDAEKKYADDKVKTLGATVKEVNRLNQEALDLDRKAANKAVEIQAVNDALRKAEAVKVNLDRSELLKGGAGIDIAKNARLKSALKERFDLLNDELKGINENRNAVKGLYTDMSEALNAQANNTNAIKEEQLANTKYFSEEERKITLSNKELELEDTKVYNQMILDNELSSEEDRINATKGIAEVEQGLADAKRQYIITNANATRDAIIEAENDYAEKSAEIERKRAKDVAKIIKDFYLKRTELVFLAADAEIRANQLATKEVMDNEENSYEKRMEAFKNYTNIRISGIQLQYEKDLKVAKDTLPDELYILKKKQLDAQLKASTADVENDIRKQTFAIATSWFDKMFKEIKRQGDLNESAAQDIATDELINLNNQFKNKEISYKEYARRIEEIERNSRNNINNARIQDDREELSRLEGAQQEARNKLAGGIISLFLSPTQAGVGAVQGLQQNLDKANEAVIGSQKELSKDTLTAAQQDVSVQKKLEEDKANNYKQLQAEAINFIEQIGNQAFEARMERIQEEQDAFNDMIENQLEAIERSTISSKEKNAYEIQLNAQRDAREEESAKKQKKLAHDQAVFNKEMAIGEIILNTSIAIVSALKYGALGVPLAISIGALGAAQLATALAVKIPSYAEGGIHKGGDALFGEAGSELVKEPGGRTYIADKPTIKHLPAGTELIPLYKIPVFPEKRDSTWEQTMYLGKQIQKSNRAIKNIFKPKINVDISKQMYVNRILYG